MKKICLTSTILFIALLSLGLFGCGQDAQILQPSVEEPEVFASPPKPVATDSSVSVVSMTHYGSWKRIPDNELLGTVEPGDTIYTEVVFSRDVWVKPGEDKTARPILKVKFNKEVLRLSIVPHTTKGKEFVSGSAKPVRGKRIFLCKYTVPEGVEGTFSVIAQAKGSVGHSEVLNVEVPFVEPPPEDFTGHVYIPATWRHEGAPVQGVQVTIIAGERAGEYVMTDGDGAYTFPEVTEDELQVRVTKEGYEPKEVTVYRTEPTRLANGVVVNFVVPFPVNSLKTTQKTPGVILIGLEWPEEAREILARTEVVHDLLLIEIDISADRGYYSAGVVEISNTLEKNALQYSVLAHEIAHAHQDSLFGLDGSGALDCGGHCWGRSEQYETHPQGREFVEAWKKDLEEFGKSPLDTNQHYEESSKENSAEIISYWWGLGTWWESAGEWHGNLQETAPNRMTWVRKWFPKS